jgi:hypothetical protein
VAIGESKAVVRRYLDAVDEETAQRLLDENARSLLEPAAPTTVEAPPRRWGSGPLRITSVEMVDDAGVAGWSFAPLSTVTIRLRYTATRALAEPIFSVLIHKLDGYYLWASNTFDHPIPPILAAGDGILQVQVEALALTAGRYYLSAAAYPEPDPPYWSHPSDFHDQLYQFQIISDTIIHGDIVMPTQWRHETAQAATLIPVADSGAQAPITQSTITSTRH